MTQTRRDFLRSALASAALGSSGVWVPGCQARPPQRKEVLAALVLDIVVPQTDDAKQHSELFGAAVARLVAAPAPDTLRAARDAWRPALLAWKRAQCFPNGPIVDTNALVRTTFWPARPAAIDAALAASTPIDDAFVADLGVDARGFYALERLLFEHGEDLRATGEAFTGVAGQRRRELAGRLAHDITKYAGAVAKTLGDGEAFAARFADGALESLATLVNQMVGTVENLTPRRLRLVLGADAEPALLPSEVEGGLGGISHEIALAQVTGMNQLYRGGDGGGLTDLASHVAPAIDARVRRRFAEAFAALKPLKTPLERLVTTDRPGLTAVTGTAKALELALKVDLVSALGITMTFQSNDGD